MGDEEPGPEWLFRILDRMHHSMIDREIERRGLGEASHPFLLFAVAERGPRQPLSQAEIAERLRVSQPTAAVSIRRMEAAGLLRKVADPADRRRNRVTLTPKGSRLVRECRRAFGDIDRGMLADFSDAEREILKAHLLRMIRNLEAMGAARPPAPARACGGPAAEGKGRQGTC